MNYQETLEYLYTQLPMFTRIGEAAYKADLTNTIALCKLLDNPQNKFKSVHIAGTNGKGSSSHLLASILQEAGYKVGLYTSPHIKDFKERIRINGKKVEEQFVIDFTAKIKHTFATIEPSFFEITVAMAFEYFATQHVDIAIIEVGLGGLLDSTNIITPELCLITNIGMDHTNLLGNTLQEIATQKAGIIKQNIPVVISETQTEIEQLFRNIALQKNAHLVFADAVYDVVTKDNTAWEHQNIMVVNRAVMSITHYQMPLLGIYQQKNIKGVLACCNVLQHQMWKILPENIANGILHVKNNTGLYGRWDVLQTNPIIIADVGHNAEGIQEIFTQIKKINYKQLHIITGFMADKNVEKALAQFPKHAQFYFTQAQLPRAMAANKVKEIASSVSLQGNAFANVNLAIADAKNKANANDVILICGSFFILAELDGYGE